MIYKSFFDLKDLQYVTRYGCSGFLDPDSVGNTLPKKPHHPSHRNSLDEDSEALEKFARPKKKIKLIYMTPTFSNINPIHSIRVMDYIFPLDSSFLNTKAKDRKKFSPFGDLRTIKRITICEKDLKSGTWCYHLEEKNLEREKIYKGIATYKYFIEWLQSLGDMRAYKLSELIGEYISRLDKVQFQSSLLHLSSGTGRVYQKVLTARTHAYINSNPWYKRIHSLDIESGQGTLRRWV
jgi:hypothetical protein